MKQDEQQGIVFERVALESIDFKVNPDSALPEKEIPLSINIDLKRQLNKAKNRLKLVVGVKVIFEGIDNPPMNISVFIAGYFSVKKKKEFELLEEFSKIQAPALVFPFVREVIANITSRTDYPPILLPPANIRALVGKSERKTRVTKRK